MYKISLIDGHVIHGSDLTNVGTKRRLDFVDSSGSLVSSLVECLTSTEMDSINDEVIARELALTQISNAALLNYTKPVRAYERFGHQDWIYFSTELDGVGDILVPPRESILRYFGKLIGEAWLKGAINFRANSGAAALNSSMQAFMNSHVLAKVKELIGSNAGTPTTLSGSSSYSWNSKTWVSGMMYDATPDAYGYVSFANIPAHVFAGFQVRIRQSTSHDGYQIYQTPTVTASRMHPEVLLGLMDSGFVVPSTVIDANYSYWVETYSASYVGPSTVLNGLMLGNQVPNDLIGGSITGTNLGLNEGATYSDLIRFYQGLKWLSTTKKYYGNLTSGALGMRLVNVDSRDFEDGVESTHEVGESTGSELIRYTQLVSGFLVSQNLRNFGPLLASYINEVKGQNRGGLQVTETELLQLDTTAEIVEAYPRARVELLRSLDGSLYNQSEVLGLTKLASLAQDAGVDLGSKLVRAEPALTFKQLDNTTKKYALGRKTVSAIYLGSSTINSALYEQEGLPLNLVVASVWSVELPLISFDLRFDGLNTQVLLELGESVDKRDYVIQHTNFATISSFAGFIKYLVLDLDLWKRRNFYVQEGDSVMIGALGTKLSSFFLQCEQVTGAAPAPSVNVTLSNTLTRTIEGSMVETGLYNEVIKMYPSYVSTGTEEQDYSIIPDHISASLVEWPGLTLDQKARSLLGNRLLGAEELTSMLDHAVTSSVKHI